MTDDLNGLPAEEVIEKFGGVRPLANRLGIAASTVQGWKERGNIPDNRIEDILMAAQEDGIVLFDNKPATPQVSEPTTPSAEKPQSRFTADQKPSEKATETPPPAAPVPEEDRREYSDRRSAGDRRQRIDPNYKGPNRRVGDRRSGLDRRQQRAAEWAHKKKFLERSLLTMAFIFMAVVLAGVFLMMPEYKALQEQAAQYEQVQSELSRVNQRLENLSDERMSASGRINDGLNALEQAKNEIMKQVESAEKLSEEFASRNWQQRLNLAEQKVYGFYTMMDRAAYLLDTPGGQEALDNALVVVENALSGAADATVNDLQQLRTSDPVLATVLRDVKAEDLQAAMMLLTLAEVRETMGRGNVPFNQDLELLRQLGGDDPEVMAAINRLAPYAENGVLSTETLETEFSGLAGDIVMAKLRGQDDTIRDQAVERFSRLMTIRKVDDLQGDTTDAVVARAQLKIEGGDIQGAITELQKLDGAAAEVAQPWLVQATQRAQADMATNTLINQVMGSVMQGQNLNAQGLDTLVRSLFGRLNAGNAPYVSQAPKSNGASYPGLTSD